MRLNFKLVFLLFFPFLVNAQIDSLRVKTVHQLIDELSESYSKIGLKFRPNAKEEDIFWGIQHSLGKKFEATPLKLTKVADYYSTIANIVKENPLDLMLLREFVPPMQKYGFDDDNALHLKEIIAYVKQEMSSNNKKSSYFMLNDEELGKINYDANPRQFEVDQDPRAKLDKHGPVDIYEFHIPVENGNKVVFIFGKSYLLSLLEPIKK